MYIVHYTVFVYYTTKGSNSNHEEFTYKSLCLLGIVIQPYTKYTVQCIVHTSTIPDISRGVGDICLALIG